MIELGIQQLLELKTQSAAEALLFLTNRAAAEIQRLAERDQSLFAGLLAKQSTTFIPYRLGQTWEDAEKWLKRIGFGQAISLKPGVPEKARFAAESIGALAARAAREIETARLGHARDVRMVDGKYTEIPPTHWPRPTGKLFWNGDTNVPEFELVPIKHGSDFEEIVKTVGWWESTRYLPDPPPAMNRKAPVFRSLLVVARAWRSDQAKPIWKHLSSQVREREKEINAVRTGTKISSLRSKKIMRSYKTKQANHAEASFRDSLLAAFRTHYNPFGKHAPKVHRKSRRKIS